MEEDYEKSVSHAVKTVSGSDRAWLFLRSLRDRPNAKPWIAQEEDGRILVAIPATTRDHTWQTIDTTRCDDDYIRSVADEVITEDGTEGEMVRVLQSGGYPILIAHWQSLMSNGLGTGLKVLDEIGKRIQANLADRVEWMSFEEIMHHVAEHREEYPKPQF